MLPAEATNTLVAAAIISISINPLLYRTSTPLAWLAVSADRVRKPGSRSFCAAAATVEQLDEAKVESDTNIAPSSSATDRSAARWCGCCAKTKWSRRVIDLNVPSDSESARTRHHGIYGDASQREILRGAGVPRPAR